MRRIDRFRRIPLVLIFLGVGAHEPTLPVGFRKPPVETDVDNPTPVPTIVAAALTMSPTQLPTEVITVAPSPSPTLPPSPSPTLQPITESPTLVPTELQTTAPTPVPIDRSTLSPTKMPTDLPTSSPTQMPTDSLTMAPTILLPSVPPSDEADKPSPILITKGPNRGTSDPTLIQMRTALPSVAILPTLSPSTRSLPTVSPSAISLPTVSPSLPPSLSSSPPTSEQSMKSENSSKPTSEKWVAESVPIRFDAVVESNNMTADELARACEAVWEPYILFRLQAAFRTIDHAFVQKVNLTVTAEEENDTENRFLRRRLRRSLQESTKFAVQAVGEAVLQADSNQVDPQDVAAEANNSLESIVTQENMQQAMEQGDVPAIVSSVEYYANSPEEQQRHIPTTAETIVGFTLAGLVALSLFFWAYVLWKKQRKRIRRRRQSAMRKSQSYVVSNTATSASTVRAPPSMNNSTLRADDSNSGGSSSSDETSSYKGLESEDDDEDEVSEFARELQQAASIDEAAWNEFQRKKQEIETHPEYGSFADPAAAYGFYDAPGSQEEGMEIDARGIERISSFPYGDENDSIIGQTANAQHEFELTLKDAVEWTSTGIALKVLSLGESEEDDGQFEPYGDSRKSRSFEQSWDLDAYPVVDTDGPSQYSFLYPLKRRELSDNTRTTPTETSDDPSSAAVRASPAVSSLSTALAVAPIHSSEGDEDTESRGSEDDIMTHEMLREVARLSQYVKRYEQKKELRKNIHREMEMERSRKLHSSVLDASSLTINTSSLNTTVEESRSISFVPYDALNDSLSARRRASANYTRRPAHESAGDELDTTFFGGEADPELGELDSTSESTVDDDDDQSQRLGISRFSVEKPPDPMLSFRRATTDSSEDDPLPSPPRNAPPSEYSQQGVRQRFGIFHSTAALEEPDNARYLGPEESLSALRADRAFFDGTTASEDDTGTTNTSSVPFDEERRKKNTPSNVAAFRENAAAISSLGLSPHTRSKNEDFNNILSMFEAKPSTSIVPPNENWQHDGLGDQQEMS